jgi:hypothetical protein
MVLSPPFHEGSSPTILLKSESITQLNRNQPSTRIELAQYRKGSLRTILERAHQYLHGTCSFRPDSAIEVIGIHKSCRVVVIPPIFNLGVCKLLLGMVNYAGRARRDEDRFPLFRS